MLTTSDFRVLTINGWRPFADIKVGDYVFSRVNGKMVESKVKLVTNQPYDGLTYKVKGNLIECEVTPTYELLFMKRQDYKENNIQFHVSIEEVYNNRKRYNHHPIPKTAKWETNNYSDLFVIHGVNRKKYGSDKSPTGGDYNDPLILNKMKFAAFLGIYLAEGSLSGRNVIDIAQKNEIGRSLLRELLPRIHPDIIWHESNNGFSAIDGRLYDYLKPLCNCYHKYIPLEVKNFAPEYLEELIHWFAVGDGRMLVCNNYSRSTGRELLNCKDSLAIEHDHKRLDLGKFSRMDIFSTSERLMDDFHECIVKVGRCAAKSTIITKEDYEYGEHIIKASLAAPLYQIHIGRSKFIYPDTRFLKINKSYHAGDIYGLSLEHNSFYIERAGHCWWVGKT